MDGDDSRPMMIDGQSFSAWSQSSPVELRWKVGIEVPPFVASNASVISLLKDLVDGAVESVPIVHVSEAVAVQIYRLIYDKNARPPAFKGLAERGLYIILASLARGTRTLPPDVFQPKSLRLALGEIRSGKIGL